MPTSITTAPGFSQWPLTISVLPAAAITMSASRTALSIASAGVRLCTIVTVASHRQRS